LDAEKGKRGLGIGMNIFVSSYYAVINGSCPGKWKFESGLTINPI
jgi:hypothetical protein